MSVIPSSLIPLLRGETTRKTLSWMGR